jgi:hypothetical protein
MLNKIFAIAVDGANSNAYGYLLMAFESMPVEAKKINVSLGNIYNALKPLSKKWEKEIDKVIGQ